MTSAAVEVHDLTAALTIADDATCRWRRKPHHDDVNQAARIAVWRTFDAGHHDRRILYRTARSAAIDELRRLTGRSDAARAAGRTVTLDFVHAVHRDCEPFPPSQLYGLTGRLAVLADAIAAGELGQDIAAALGVHPSRVSQLRTDLRRAITKANRPGGHP